MSVEVSLTIIAVVMILMLLVLMAMLGFAMRTHARVDRLLDRAEQELTPILFDLKVAIADLRRLTQMGRAQMGRVDYTIRYVSGSLMEISDTLLHPIQEARGWYKALGIGLRYFFRRR